MGRGDARGRAVHAERCASARSLWWQRDGRPRHRGRIQLIYREGTELTRGANGEAMGRDIRVCGRGQVGEVGGGAIDPRELASGRCCR